MPDTETLMLWAHHWMIWHDLGLLMVCCLCSPAGLPSQHPHRIQRQPSRVQGNNYFLTTDEPEAQNAVGTGTFDAASGLTRNGYYNVTACYTKPGYGYYSGAASICPKGYYNAGNNREPCTRCPNGKSTFFEGSPSVADCIAYAAGYGKVGSAAALCYTGTYNDGSSET
jgi:hypothetical protein